VEDKDGFGGDEGELPAYNQDGKLTLFAQTTFEEDKAVLFVDLLGFSRLTLKWPVIKDQFWLLDRPSEQDFLRVRLEATGNNRLREQPSNRDVHALQSGH
jgi:hypothetical protein